MLFSTDRYTSALQALSHALLLSPQNPFTFLQFAETAYTAGDLPLALKMFLVVIDMGERDLPKDEPPTAINVRAWLGVKLVSDASWSTSSSPCFNIRFNDVVFTPTSFFPKFFLCISHSRSKNDQAHR